MQTFISIFTTFVKLAPRYLAVIGIASVTILFASNSILSKFGLLYFANDYRPWISITAICGIGFIVVDFVIWCWKNLVVLAKKMKSAQDMKKYLRSLTEEEKEILRFYIFQKTKTNSLDPDDGIVNGLENAGIIYTTTIYGSILDGHPFNISGFAWNYLNKRPDLLHGETSTQRTDKIEW